MSNTRVNTGSGPGQQSLGLLWGLGIIQAVLYVAIAWLSRDFVFRESFQQRPIPLVLSLFAICFVLYAVSMKLALRFHSRMQLLGAILFPALIFRAVLLFSEPIQEIDIYRYLWDGAVSASGVSPFGYAPGEVLSAEAEAPIPLDLKQLVQLRDRSPVLAEILSRVHYAELPTVYPPVSQTVFALGAWLTPTSASLTSQVTILKGVLLLFDVATIALIGLLLRDTGQHPGWLVSYAWCPLVLKEFANSGHLDSIALLFTTAGLWCVTRGLRKAELHSLRWLALGAVLLGLAVGAKLYAIVLLPLLTVGIIVYARPRYGAAFALLSLVVAGGSLAPMTFARPKESSSLDRPQANIDLPEKLSPTPTASPPQATSSLSGMSAFLSRWEMNDFLFMICIENLRPRSVEPNQAPACFAVTPEIWRTTAIQPVAKAFSIDMGQAAFIVTRTMMTGIFLGIAGLIIRHAISEGTVTALLEGAFLTLAWFWLTSPTQNPWYWTWALPLLPFARGRAWFAMSGIAFAYYLRFWLLYHWPESPILGTRYNGPQFFDFVVTWLEYGPWFVWLSMGAFVRKRRIGRGQFEQTTPSVGKFTEQEQPESIN